MTLTPIHYKNRNGFDVKLYSKSFMKAGNFGFVSFLNNFSNFKSKCPPVSKCVHMWVSHTFVLAFYYISSSMDLINRCYQLGGLQGLFTYLFELLIAEMPKSKQQMFKPTLTTDYL